MDGSEYDSDSPYRDTLAWNANADNATLCASVIAATRHAWTRIEWPRTTPPEDAARLAHELARTRVRYVREDGDQLIRMPWRTLSDGVGDCKSFAVLVASLCKAAGRSVVLRFAQYAGEDHFGHVYAVVDGVAVDPELPFGDEVTAEFTIDRRL